jgi:hypothetical protein
MTRTRNARALAAAALGSLAAMATAACDKTAPSPMPAGGSGASARSARPAAAGAPWFEEVAARSGFDFRHVRAFKKRFWFPELVGSGLAWIDYDGDGNLDLYCVQSGDLAPEGHDQPGNKLYRNKGDGTFEDVTDTAGVGDKGYGMGCCVGDYDGDGDPDLYVTNVGTNVLYRNNGDGTFTDVTAEAGVGHSGWSTSCGFFDCDGDGDLDLFVVNYVRWAPEREVNCKSTYGDRDYCAPNNYNAPSQSVLYRNDGGGHFTDVSEEAGLLAAFGNGLGLALVDFDRDGKLDAYVSNDGNPNQLWINQGGGKFVDKALLAGCAVNRNGAAEASMGTVPVDIDDDGWIDLFITNLRGETNTFYFNKKGVFTDRTPQTGLTMPSLQYTGFGDGFADFDLDGRLDLYVVNGRVGFWKPTLSEADPYVEPNQLFRGLDGARFEEVQPQGGIATTHYGVGRGAAFGDYDNDGDVDVAYIENNGSVRLLKNIAARQGHWIELRIVNAKGADALGASVSLRAGGRTIFREIAPCSSYASSNDPRAHFGLGPAASVDEVVVTWPGGARESFGPLAVEKLHVLKQGRGRAAPGSR